jgi:hypothetical protein
MKHAPPSSVVACCTRHWRPVAATAARRARYCRTSTPPVACQRSSRSRLCVSLDTWIMPGTPVLSMRLAVFCEARGQPWGGREACSARGQGRGARPHGGTRAKGTATHGWRHAHSPLCHRRGLQPGQASWGEGTAKGRQCKGLAGSSSCMCTQRLSSYPATQAAARCTVRASSSATPTHSISAVVVAQGQGAQGAGGVRVAQGVLWCRMERSQTRLVGCPGRACPGLTILSPTIPAVTGPE